MMTQEEYVNGVLALKRQGKTITEIAEELGYHPATISNWLRAGGPPPARGVAPAGRLIDERWAARIAQLVQPPAEKLLATSVFEIIRAEGFEGSYQTVVRDIADAARPPVPGGAGGERADRDGPRARNVSSISRTAGLDRAVGAGRVVVLRAHLVLVPLAAVVVHRLGGPGAHLRGPGPLLRGGRRGAQVGRTDRMGALGLRRASGSVCTRRRSTSPAIHSIEIKACQARDAKRKASASDRFGT